MHNRRGVRHRKMAKRHMDAATTESEPRASNRADGSGNGGNGGGVTNGELMFACSNMAQAYSDNGQQGNAIIILKSVHWTRAGSLGRAHPETLQTVWQLRHCFGPFLTHFQAHAPPHTRRMTCSTSIVSVHIGC